MERRTKKEKTHKKQAVFTTPPPPCHPEEHGDEGSRPSARHASKKCPSPARDSSPCGLRMTGKVCRPVRPPVILRSTATKDPVRRTAGFVKARAPPAAAAKRRQKKRCSLHSAARFPALHAAVSFGTPHACCAMKEIKSGPPHAAAARSPLCLTAAPRTRPCPCR